MNDRPIIELGITALAELFNRQLSPATLKLYVSALEGLSIEVITDALEAAAATCEFFPLPFVIRKMAGVVSDDDQAVGAWAEVLDTVGIGSWSWVDFADGTINATIRNLGGWPTFVSRFTDAASEKWVRQEFLKTYVSLRNSGTVAGPLAGLSEKEASGGTVRDPVPVRIGTDRPNVLTITDESKTENTKRDELRIFFWPIPGDE